MKRTFVKITLALCVMIIGATGTAFGAASDNYSFDFSRTNCMEKFFEYCNDKLDSISKIEEFINCTIKNDCDNDESQTPDTDATPDTDVTPDTEEDENNNNNNNNNNSNDNNTDNNNNGNDNNGNNGNDSDESDDQNMITGASQQVKQVLNLVNEERNGAGLSSLTMNSALNKVAQAKAEDMRDNNYFSHTSPTYGSPFEMMKQFGIKYTAAGENIAKGQKTAESVMNAWMNSSGHRENIMSSDYTQIGVGYCTDAKGNTYWVQMFIR